MGSLFSHQTGTYANLKQKKNMIQEMFDYYMHAKSLLNYHEVWIPHLRNEDDIYLSYLWYKIK